jgi:deoxyribodipyrimidine photo-lyase
MTQNPSIVWFRRDLRLADNRALAAALEHGGSVIPIFILPAKRGSWHHGEAVRWWLQASLQSLDGDLRARGSRLVLLRGSYLAVLRGLLVETGASAIFLNRLYEPEDVRLDAAVMKDVAAGGTKIESFDGSLLREPWTIHAKTGGPYRVFSPFHRVIVGAIPPARSSSAPRAIPAPKVWPRSNFIDDLGLNPTSARAAALRESCRPGERGAAELLDRFCRRPLREYPVDRDRPGRAGTSRLSPHLHFGEITPGRVFHAVAKAASARREPGWLKAAEAFQRQLVWREFAHHLLHHFPDTPNAPLRAEFAAFPWRRNKKSLEAWQKGRTGFPIVDAGMRELWATGWLHNRVRMIVASFLVKDLLIPWSDGARWFWETLVDADLANNTLGWQWAAGCGADAAPFFRIFNPTVQGEKFDPQGEYVRRWIPEIAALPDEWIHRPSEAPREVLESAGVRIGGNYPAPVVDHAAARVRALAALASMRRRGTNR